MSPRTGSFPALSVVLVTTLHSRGGLPFCRWAGECTGSKGPKASSGVRLESWLPDSQPCPVTAGELGVGATVKSEGGGKPSWKAASLTGVWSLESLLVGSAHLLHSSFSVLASKAEVFRCQSGWPPGLAPSISGTCGLSPRVGSGLPPRSAVTRHSVPQHPGPAKAPSHLAPWFQS